MTKRHARVTGVLLAGVVATILVVPAFAASAPSEKLVNFEIVGPATAKAGKVTFKVANTSTIGHELVVIRTDTKASKLPKTASGRASEGRQPRRGRAEGRGVEGPRSHARARPLRAALQRRVTTTREGMRKDFTVS